MKFCARTENKALESITGSNTTRSIRTYQYKKLSRNSILVALIYTLMFSGHHAHTKQTPIYFHAEDHSQCR